MTIRKATLDDIESLIRLRVDYLTEEKGSLTQDDESAIRTQLRKYFSKHIPVNTFVGILAEIDGEIVSTAYLSIFEKPANQAFITGVTGTLFNVLTYPRYRRKGIASKVIKQIVEEARGIGVSCLDLSATSDGKKLYEKFGFKEHRYTPMYLPFS